MTAHVLERERESRKKEAAKGMLQRHLIKASSLPAQMSPAKALWKREVASEMDVGTGLVVNTSWPEAIAWKNKQARRQRAQRLRFIDMPSQLKKTHRERDSLLPHY